MSDEILWHHIEKRLRDFDSIEVNWAAHHPDTQSALRALMEAFDTVKRVLPRATAELHVHNAEKRLNEAMQALADIGSDPPCSTTNA